LIVIPNQNLFRIANENTTFTDAFKMADEVLHSGVRGVTDLITMPGLINLDFADIKTVMSEMGKAMMGTGEASGEERAIKAAEAAIANPLLDHTSMSGAKGVLINITGGKDMTLYEVDSAANRIREEVGDSDANIIFGSTFNPELQGVIRVSVVATGIDSEAVNIARQGRQEFFAAKADNEESLIEEEFSEEIEEIPAYEEEGQQAANDAYDGSEAEIQERLARLAAHMDFQSQNIGQQSILPVSSEQQKQQQPQQSKQSLLKRMWNSLKVAESNDAPSEAAQNNYAYEEKKDLLTPAISKSGSEIQDVPAFLRKNM